MPHRFITLGFALALSMSCWLAGCSSSVPTTSQGTAFPEPAHAAPDADAHGIRTAVFAGGCFWGMQWVFEHVRGVQSVTAGYAGGTAATATYDQVSEGDTGHAESVRVRYDPSRISYAQLLKVYFAVATDPTQLDRQGPDVGRQYRGAIFYTSANQRRIAEDYIAELRHRHVYDAPIVTRVVPLAGFYRAEAYHQHYADKHPHDLYIVINDAPKIDALRERLPTLYRSDAAVASP